MPHFDKFGGDEWICQVCHTVKDSRTESEWRPDITKNDSAGNVCPSCKTLHEGTGLTGHFLRAVAQMGKPMSKPTEVIPTDVGAAVRSVNTSIGPTAKETIKMTIRDKILEMAIRAQEKRLGILKAGGGPRIVIEGIEHNLERLRQGLIEIGGDVDALKLEFKKIEEKTGRMAKQFFIFNSGAVLYFPEARYGRFVKRGNI